MRWLARLRSMRWLARPVHGHLPLASAVAGRPDVADIRAGTALRDRAVAAWARNDVPAALVVDLDGDRDPVIDLDLDALPQVLTVVKGPTERHDHYLVPALVGLLLHLRLALARLRLTLTPLRLALGRLRLSPAVLVGVLVGVEIVVGDPDRLG